MDKAKLAARLVRLARAITADSRKVAVKKVPLRTKVVSGTGEEHKAYLKEGKLGAVLVIDGTPGHWYVDSLLEGGVDDKAYLDYGQDWYVTGMKKLMAEVMKRVEARYTIL